jgi:hypothetical protein
MSSSVAGTPPFSLADGVPVLLPLRVWLELPFASLSDLIDDLASSGVKHFPQQTLFLGVTRLGASRCCLLRAQWNNRAARAQ